MQNLIQFLADNRPLLIGALVALMLIGLLTTLRRGSRSTASSGLSPKRVGPKADWIDPRYFLYLGIATLYVLASLWVAGATNMFCAIATFVLLAGSTVVHDLIELPADDPPTVAILKIFGFLVPYRLKGGYQLIPWRKVLCDTSKLIVIKKRDFDLPERELVTPDDGVVKVKPSLAYMPNEHSARDLIDYILMGEAEGVERNLDQVIDQRMKSWAISDIEGPESFREAMAADDEATLVVLKRLVGAALTEVASDIPTQVLLRFLHKPQLPPTVHMAKRYSDDPVKQDWNKLQREWDALSSKKRAEIEDAVAIRREEIKRVQAGHGAFRKEGFGILILRLNLGEILPSGPTAEALGKKVREELEADAEMVETEGNLHRAETIFARFKKLFGKDPTFEEVRDWDQTERNKTTRQIHDVRGSSGVVPLLHLGTSPSIPSPTAPSGTVASGGTT